MSNGNGSGGRPDGAHGAHGEFIRTPEQIALDQEACQLRSGSMSYRQIGAQLGVSISTAHRMVQRGIDDIPKEAAIEVRAMELAKLDRLERHLLGVMGREHLQVAHGRVVRAGNVPVIDDGPGVQAAMALLRVMDRRARLLGLDAPSRHVVDVIPHEVIEAEADRLEAEIAAYEQGLRDAAAEAP